MDSSEIYQVVGTMQQGGDAYGAISSQQGQTAQDGLHDFNATGVTWTDPTFLDAHGNVTLLTNDMSDESQLNAARQAGMYNVVDATNNCSSTCSSIAQSL